MKLLKFSLLSALVFGLFLAICMACSCTKASAEIGQGRGYKGLLIGEKYSENWKLIKIDTLWQDNNVPYIEWLKVLAVKKVDTIGKADCPPLTTIYINGNPYPVQYEIRKYIY